MTRIGRVTVRLEDARHYLPTVLQYVAEDGELTLAKFEFNGWRYRRVDGWIVDDVPHAEYRRVA